MDVKEFGWSPEEWERARRWATGVDSPADDCASLWDWAKSEDSVWTLHRLNAHLRRSVRRDGSPEKTQKSFPPSFTY